ncbi:MAG: polymerase delta [Verrucomicrobiales bacterium]|nr:polymerase delta [Verrucomicrobiales bacterium]
MASAGFPTAPLVLVAGEDDFAARQRAREIFHKWSADLGGMDHEIIDAAVTNGGDALKALSKLREALQTLPFFGGGKAVWLRDCSFLGDDRTASSQAVTENLASLTQELKAFDWKNVRLLISAAKVDKRKSFYKAIEKIGAVENFAGWSIEDKDWVDQAEMFARGKMRQLKKEISDEALSELVANVGPNPRQLDNEVEKVMLFAADHEEISIEDVREIVTRNKQARAFAFGDAFGERDLPRVLRCLDEELWEMKTDKDKSEIGLLYGLITKVRVLIFSKELLEAGWLKLTPNFAAFKTQLERVPVDALPEDKKFNPLSMNPYVLFKALAQAKNYSQSELVRAMQLLLDCNQKLISSRLDNALILQQTIVEIVGRPAVAR